MIKQAEAQKFYDKRNVGYIKNLHNEFSLLLQLKYSSSL
jgi:hypothetical protein